MIFDDVLRESREKEVIRKKELEKIKKEKQIFSKKIKNDFNKEFSVKKARKKRVVECSFDSCQNNFKASWPNNRVKYCKLHREEARKERNKNYKRSDRQIEKAKSSYRKKMEDLRKDQKAYSEFVEKQAQIQRNWRRKKREQNPIFCINCKEKILDSQRFRMCSDKCLKESRNRASKEYQAKKREQKKMKTKENIE